MKIGLLEGIQEGQKIRLGPLAYVLMLCSIIIGIVFWDLQSENIRMADQSKMATVKVQEEAVKDLM